MFAAGFHKKINIREMGAILLLLQTIFPFI